jgi:hypothetical protein
LLSTRNIPGIDGSLQAIEETDKVVVLQLHDLQGNIAATAADNETETKLISTYNSTEFGVPSEGKTPPKYAWLGAGGLATETAFGTGISTQGGASYIPQVARNLQTAPVIPPGAFPNGIGGGEQYTATISAGEMASAQAIATQIFQEAEAARQEAKKREAEEAAERKREEMEPESLVVEYGLEGTEAVAASGKNKIPPAKAGVCKFWSQATSSSETDFTLYNITDRYACSTNVDITMWNTVEEETSPIYEAGYSRGGAWSTEIWNPYATRASRVGLCVNLKWINANGRQVKAGKCFTLSLEGFLEEPS